MELDVPIGDQVAPARFWMRSPRRASFARGTIVEVTGIAGVAAAGFVSYQRTRHQLPCAPVLGADARGTRHPRRTDLMISRDSLLDWSNRFLAI